MSLKVCRKRAIVLRIMVIFEELCFCLIISFVPDAKLLDMKHFQKLLARVERTSTVRFALFMKPTPKLYCVCEYKIRCVNHLLGCFVRERRLNINFKTAKEGFSVMNI